MTEAHEAPSEPSHVMTRAEIAYELKVQGKSLSEIGVELDIDPSHVARLITKQISTEADLLSMEEKDTLLAIDNARIERLIQAHYTAAVYGDLRSGEFILKCVALHAKINKLDIPDAVINQHQVLVVGGEASDYIERLKQLSG
jgi:hypothetical protein